MADVRITAAAKAHLLGIREYTAALWCEDQADASLREIKTAFDRLAEIPLRGIHRPEIATSYRSLPWESPRTHDAQGCRYYHNPFGLSHTDHVLGASFYSQAAVGFCVQNLPPLISREVPEI
ncbi:MAG: type II toxin-antitoxin system RelE/ParE family toxin [Desulfovibrio sp.]